PYSLFQPLDQSTKDKEHHLLSMASHSLCSFLLFRFRQFPNLHFHTILLVPPPDLAVLFRTSALPDVLSTPLSSLVFLHPLSWLPLSQNHVHVPVSVQALPHTDLLSAAEPHGFHPHQVLPQLPLSFPYFHQPDMYHFLYLKYLLLSASPRFFL